MRSIGLLLCLTMSAQAIAQAPTAPEPPFATKGAFFWVEGGGLIVELLQRDDAMPLSKAAPAVHQNYRIHGFFKAGLVVDDFDATLARDDQGCANYPSYAFWSAAMSSFFI